MHGFAVRVAVCALTIAHVFGSDGKVIVTVFSILGSDMIEMFPEVFVEQRFFFIHEY